MKSKGRKTLKTFVPITSKNSASGDVIEGLEREELKEDVLERERLEGNIVQEVV